VRAQVRVARLNLVDLAGSEKVAKAGTSAGAGGPLTTCSPVVAAYSTRSGTGAGTSGERLVEGSNINKSLLTLGLVISNLAELCKHPDKKGVHVPYRDSKLTRLLAGSIGGNAVCSVVCNCSPASRNYDETRSTLLFANRCKNIVNKVRVNEVADSATLMAAYKNEISVLKQRMTTAKTMAPSASRLEMAKQAEAKLADLTALIILGAEKGRDTKQTVDKIRQVAEGKRHKESIMTELETGVSAAGAAGGRKMSSMMLNSLASISQLNNSLVPPEMRVKLGGLGAFEEDEEDEDETGEGRARRGKRSGAGEDGEDAEEDVLRLSEEELSALTAKRSDQAKARTLVAANRPARRDVEADIDADYACLDLEGKRPASHARRSARPARPRAAVLWLSVVRHASCV
jgi:hypothetical protein